MNSTCFVAIDLGTSALRLTVFNNQGTTIFSKEIALPGQNISDWLDALILASPKTILNEINPENIHVSICSTSGTIILVNDIGKPLINPIMYFEHAPKNEVEIIQALTETRELINKGVTISSTSPICKLVHFKKSNSHLYQQIKWVLPPSAWLLYRILIPENHPWNNISIDWTNGLKFGMDITKQNPEWFYPIFNQLNISHKLLPTLQACGTFIGNAQSKLADKIGLSGTNLYQGMTDGTATALVTGSLQTDRMGLSVGSSSTLKYSSQEIRTHPAIYHHKHPIYGYLAGSAPITGVMLSWFMKNILNLSINESQIYAEKVKPGTEFLYFPQGDREPFNSNQMGASFLGLWPTIESSDMIPGLFIRSIMLGISLAERSLIKIIEKRYNTKIEFIGLTGGGSKNQLWNKIRAAVYDIPLKIIDTPTTFGPLIPVILNIGLCKNSKELEDKFIRTREVIYPDEHLVNVYKEYNKLFMKKWTLLKQIYEQ